MINRVKEQKGMTLIELLAVIVILGIISAIAIPSILGLIDNSKKDAHIANARQMINSAKNALTADKTMIPSNGNSEEINLSYLVSKGYIDTIKDPDGGDYIGLDKDATATALSGTDPTAAPTDDSYVLIVNDNNNLTYYVRLVNSTRGVQTSGKNPVAESDLSRSNIN